MPGVLGWQQAITRQHLLLASRDEFDQCIDVLSCLAGDLNVMVDVMLGAPGTDILGYSLPLGTKVEVSPHRNRLHIARSHVGVGHDFIVPI